jgi:peptidoglycan/xylan/chitin deacetylase (PgdA/CDA1 family)
MRFVFPEGKRKALTFSYDDGQNFDRRLAELLRSHGMKGTFHLNSGRLGLRRGDELYIGGEELEEVYGGHEIACHGVEHRNLPTITRQQVVLEIQEDRKALEGLTGSLVQGMSYAFGNYNQEIMDMARALGIKYSRTIQETGNFFPPADFMAWHPTCHHNNHLLELGDSFIDIPGFYELPVMYVWGHSFEFGRTGDWSVIESFVEKMAHRDDIWYATNMEIYTYIQAVRQQEFSADGQMMYNPGAVSVWVSTQQGIREVKPLQLLR